MAQLDLNMLKNFAGLASQGNTIMETIQAYKKGDYATVLENARKLISGVAQNSSEVSKLTSEETNKFSGLGSILEYLQKQNAYPASTMDSLFDVRSLAKVAYKDPTKATEQRAKAAMEDLQDIYAYLDEHSVSM